MASGQRRRWPRRTRQLVQAAAFLAFCAFVVFAPSLAGGGRGAGGIVRLSPLGGIGASLSAWVLLTAFWPAAVLLVLAAVLGRYFCGWACPLGTTLDLSDKLLGMLRGRERRPADSAAAGRGEEFRAPASRRIKYYVLAVCLLTALLGLSLFGYLDPLSVAVRSYVVVIHAYLVRGLLWVTEALGRAPAISGLAAGGAALARRALQAPADLQFEHHAGLAVALVVLLALGLIGRRWWCRALCPLGALYALAGRWAVTARKVSDACTHCGLCGRACPTDCISPDGLSTLAGECILCLDCQAACPDDAVRFVGRGAARTVEVDLTRRGALAAAGVALLSYPLVKIAPSLKAGKGGTFIRPPLAGRDEQAFLRRCLRCGQCMRACPTQVIQPAGLEGGLESLWTPALSMRVGYCQYNCNQCGPVCPSGAIPRFSLEQKHRTAIGLAYMDQSRCIPWRGWQRRDEAGVDWERHNCGVCEEVCPAPGKAIHFRRERMPNGQELRLPYVRSESCVGCGCCEHSCPVQGQVAVRVTGGYREIEPASPAPERTLVEQALPAEAGGLRLDGPKKLYEGAKGLIEYIDGGAEPYLKFHYVRAATAGYAAGAGRVQADLWEFESSDDAFGAYSKDRSFVPEAQAVDVGDEGALADGPSLWARRGRYTITIVTMGGWAQGEQAVELARVALGALDARPAPRPRVCRRLPQAGLEPHSVLFMRHPIHLQAVVMSDELAAVLKLDGSAVAAYGAYGTGAEGRRAGLLVVEYADGAGALGALARYEELQVGRARTGQNGVTVFELGPAHFSAAGAREGCFALSLFVPDGGRAAELVRAALGAG